MNDEHLVRRYDVRLMGVGWLKVHYVLVYAILGSLLPYLAIHAEVAGLSEAQIGWVYGVFGLAVIVAPPILTNLADRWRNNRGLIGICYGAGAAALVGLAGSDSFIGITGFHLAFALVFTALIPLLDALTFATIHAPVDEATPAGAAAANAPGAGAAAGRPHTPYRAIRVFGSYGWMLPGVGFAVMLLGDFDAEQVARVALFTAAGICALGVGLLGFLPKYRVGAATEKRESAGPNVPTAAAFRALRQGDLAALVIGLVALFMSINIYYGFYSLYLARLHVPSELIGLITNIGVFVEIGCMFAAGTLLGRLGTRGVLLLGAGANLARMLLLATIPAASVAIGTQLFHGPTVLALYLIPPMYLNARAEPSYRNSIQGLYVMGCFGLARVVGTIGGGGIIDLAGGGLGGLRIGMAAAAVLALLSVAVFALCFRPRANLAAAA